MPNVLKWSQTESENQMAMQCTSVQIQYTAIWTFILHDLPFLEHKSQRHINDNHKKCGDALINPFVVINSGMCNLWQHIQWI